jgi:hypothetical protein
LKKALAAKTATPGDFFPREYPLSSRKIRKAKFPRICKLYRVINSKAGHYGTSKGNGIREQ